MSSSNPHSAEPSTVRFRVPEEDLPAPEKGAKRSPKNKKKKQNKVVKFWNILVGFEKTRKSKAFFYSFNASLLLSVLMIVFFLYGPISFFRNTLVTSAMTTLSHKYFATWFYSEDTINTILSQNKVTALTTTTDTGQIEKKSGSKMKVSDIKVTDISRNGFKGWMMEIPDPSWVRLGVPQQFGKHGVKLPHLINDYNAVAGINAGGFTDANGHGNGGTPVGMVIVDHEIIYNSTNVKHNLIGFNDDDILILGKYTTSEIKAMKIRDAVEFTPALIINGDPAEISGNGGWGYAPRTAIGQKKDGTVLFLVIDGRSATSVGATMRDILNIMLEFNAYNATNLDGGSSSVMMLNGEVLNHPSGSDSDGQRFLPNAWLVIDPAQYKLPTDRPPYTTRQSN